MFPDGNAFIAGCDDSYCKLYDLRSNCQLISYYDKENTCNATDVSVSKSRKYIYIQVCLKIYSFFIFCNNNLLIERGYLIMPWDNDSHDWQLKSNPQKIIDNISLFTENKNGNGIILMHEHTKTSQMFHLFPKFSRK